MAVQRLSSKNQIVIPREAREAMKVKGGDELLVVVRRGLTVIMPSSGGMPKPSEAWPRVSIRPII